MEKRWDRISGTAKVSESRQRSISYDVLSGENLSSRLNKRWGAYRVLYVRVIRHVYPLQPRASKVVRATAWLFLRLRWILGSEPFVKVKTELYERRQIEKEISFSKEPGRFSSIRKKVIFKTILRLFSYRSWNGISVFLLKTLYQ